MLRIIKLSRPRLLVLPFRGGECEHIRSHRPTAVHSVGRRLQLRLDDACVLASDSGRADAVGARIRIALAAASTKSTVLVVLLWGSLPGGDDGLFVPSGS